ncbi:unnamed protein product [Zymoseptoria tritici ST99CH_1E4]|uniref:Calcineurin-like phosphoesterase domain-containing protein n=1 Tax=Zymoseptoria tritici ST99CH_1E4 TaxID=1276532 RepID=A0A2H1GLB2_ZYMTR|nr:unnamed protein product [Zymoseptoria tritici ST99CH_1E4]
MRLLAIADIHLSFKANKDEWDKLEHHEEDGLILAGDVGESLEHMTEACKRATRRFKHVFWVPGNHELYTSSAPQMSDEEKSLRGEAKYLACVKVARHYGVLTPEDDFMTWTYTNVDGIEEKAIICPVFTLYDYSFRPADVSREDALDWALEEGIQATDEALLHPDPYPTRDAWCMSLVAAAESKLEKAASTNLPLVIINHWPLRQDTIYIPRVPRFTLWCGTTLTHNWHTRFNAKCVVTGHLHVRRTDWIDGVRFEEVSLGYPRQWEDAKGAGNGVNEMLREILPGPPTPVKGQEPPTEFRRFGQR